MKLFCSIILFLSLTFCQAQNDFRKKLDSVLQIKDNTIRASKLETLKKEFPEKDDENLGLLYHELGRTYNKILLYSKAIENTEKAVEIRESGKGINYVLLDESLYRLHTMYSSVGNEEKRIKTLLRIVQGTYNSKYDPYAYRNIAQYYWVKGDYFKALDYFDKVIESYPKYERESLLRIAHLWSIGVFAEMRSIDTIYTQKIKYHKDEFERIIEGADLNQQREFYSNLGVIYRSFGNQNQGLLSYKKALEKTSEGTPKSIINNTLVNIGEMYSQLKEVKKAKEYYNKVLETTDSINISAVYNNWGYYHAESVEEEIDYHQRAIQLLGFKSDFSENTSFIKKIKKSEYKPELLSALIDLSQAWIKLYNQDKNTAHLQESLKTFYAIDDLISVMRLDSSAKLSKLFWIERGVNSYLEAVKVCYLLNKLKEAFYFMEKNKSLYLLEKLEEIQVKNQYKIPNKFLDREANLGYEKFLANNKLKKNPENKLLQNAFDKASRKHFKFTDSLKSIFPEYYESNLKPQLTSLNDFQDFLREKDTQAIEYILGENEGYGLWIDEDEIKLFKLQEYSKLLDKIDLLKQMLKPSLSKNEVSQYQKIGFEVLNSLFPLENKIDRLKGNKLAIIPDGALYNFNFEVLIVDQDPILKNNFLINIAEVSYLNSASVSQNLYDKKTVSSHSYLGIAPVEFDSETLIDLKNSEKITKQIASLFSSELLVKESATKDAFLKSSKENVILHINTHAGIDNKTKTPWLALHDTLISLQEIYTSNRSHHLVFLDACKTGDGKLQKGEGIESLSRAFFHSGAKSVIASQWNANEKATNAISLSFFKELQKGSTKSFALRKAKLDYLNSNELSNTFPYFWASLTLTGNSDDLPTVSYRVYYWICIASILFIVIFLYNRKRRRNSKR
jgi:CHAT domain-containing protein